VDGPAGIDIGAKTPQEIAVSIIAAITAQRESIAVTTKRPSEAPQEKAAEATGTEDKGHCCHD
jgi:xanthine/CO dehydrogenase XdhC/CoxF family maturation factor